MRTLALCFLPACLLALLAACAPAPPAAAPSASGDTCPLVSAGPPPVCPEGCRWNGAECRKDSGIVIYDVRRPSPSPSASPKTAPPAQ
jgi:hypothetical protein